MSTCCSYDCPKYTDCEKAGINQYGVHTASDYAVRCGCGKDGHYKLFKQVDGWKLFHGLRNRFLVAVKEEAKKYPGKCYEGSMAISFYYPGIYESADDVEWVKILADCYLLGPSRHYEWSGSNLIEAVHNAAEDIDEWIEEANEANVE